MSTPILVLDHGYVRHVESWGKGDVGTEHSHSIDFECGIIEAARQSTQGSFRGWNKGDQRLLSFLYDSFPKHAGPFEFAGMTIEIQAPIFVFREWHRHRAQSYNEMSARYTPLPDLYYQPNYGNVMDRALIATVNKQAGTVTVPQEHFPEEVALWMAEGLALRRRFEEHYQQGLRIGIPKEIARFDMPVSHYSRMRATAKLRQWLDFLTLRTDPAAQWEIQQFAGAVESILLDQFPRTHALFKAELEDLRAFYAQRHARLRAAREAEMT